MRDRVIYCVGPVGAAYLLSKAIRAARMAAFADLGMEAIHVFDLHNFPVTVAVDAQGRSIHRFAAAPGIQG